MFTIVSFAAMMTATAHVLRTNWPANGMPLLAWQSHLGAIVARLQERADAPAPRGDQARCAQLVVDLVSCRYDALSGKI